MWVSYIPISICSLIIKIWKSQPGFHLLTLSSVTTRQWRLKQGWERRVHFPSCLHQAEDPPAAVTGSGHHPKCLHPHTLFKSPTSPAPEKSSVFQDTMIFMTHMKKLSKDKLLFFTECSLENQLEHLEVTSEGRKQALPCLLYFSMDMC